MYYQKSGRFLVFNTIAKTISGTTSNHCYSNLTTLVKGAISGFVSVNVV